MYTLPTFNLPVNIWRFGNALSNPPDVTAFANLALGRRIGGATGNNPTSMWLLLPPGTDIQDAFNGIGSDVVEAGAGSSRFYEVIYVDDIGAGFTNEHRFAELQKFGTWPTPIPIPTAIVPPPPPPPLFTWLDSQDSGPGGSNAIVSAVSPASSEDAIITIWVIDNTDSVICDFDGTPVAATLIGSFNALSHNAYLWQLVTPGSATWTTLTIQNAGFGVPVLMGFMVHTFPTTLGTDGPIFASGNISTPSATLTLTGTAAFETALVTEGYFDTSFVAETPLAGWTSAAPAVQNFAVVGGVFIFNAYQQPFVPPGSAGYSATTPHVSYPGWGLVMLADN